MKTISLWLIITMLAFVSCNQPKASVTTSEPVEATLPLNSTNDTIEFRNLIRQVLVWANSKNAIDLIPAVADNNDSIYTGLDMKTHAENLNKLKATGLFANGFIENYNQIILTLDRKLRNKEYGEWLVGDLQTFAFANDVDPWCWCQDVPYDEPSPWNHVEVEVVQLENNKADLIWKWGKLEKSLENGWNDSEYKIKVTKEDGSWKIAYMQGFDFEQSIKSD